MNDSPKETHRQKMPAAPRPDIDAALAPYATRNADSRGRRSAEPGHSFRQPFQRDRDRIIHSRAFRRLDGKTQVFLNGTGDHFRTRLTHTIEVTAIARTLARGLALNEDLTEAIALAHDLGHTPFGHVGERVLNELLGEEHGGFDHNLQSLRIVDCLEKKYPGIDGLNLTWEVRCGLIKHRGERPVALDGVTLPPRPRLEAQVADIADDLAYYAHDIDDGIEGGLLQEADLAGVTLWDMAHEQALHNGAGNERELLVPYTIRCLIDMLVGDVLECSRQQLDAWQPPSPAAAQALPAPVIRFSEHFSQCSRQLRDFLFERVYWHPEVIEVNQRMGQAVRDLFATFTEHPDKMGAGAQKRITEFGLERTAADYIAGMTDRFALQLHRTFGAAAGRQ
jgi:dGTPase